MLIKRTFGFSFLKFLKSFLPDIGIAVLVIGGGILSSYVMIQASNIVEIAVNAGIKLAVMGVVYLIGLLVFRQYKHLINLIKRR